MSYFSIKKAIKKQRELQLHHSELTLKYIQACKKADIWDESKKMEIMLEQIRMSRYSL